MRQLRLLTAVALIGGTAVACTTYDSRIYDSYPTQYVMAPAYTTQYVVAPAPTYTTGFTTHYVVASTYRPSYPTPVLVTEGYTPSASYVAGWP
jgi:hypothetical protein